MSLDRGGNVGIGRRYLPVLEQAALRIDRGAGVRFPSETGAYLPTYTLHNFRRDQRLVTRPSPPTWSQYKKPLNPCVALDSNGSTGIRFQEGSATTSAGISVG